MGPQPWTSMFRRWDALHECRLGALSDSWKFHKNNRRNNKQWPAVRWHILENPLGNKNKKCIFLECLFCFSRDRFLFFIQRVVTCFKHISFLSSGLKSARIFHELQFDANTQDNYTCLYMDILIWFAHKYVEICICLFGCGPKNPIVAYAGEVL